MDKIDKRYKRGKVYCVRCRYDDDLCYVGSTIQTLAKRMAAHRKNESCSLYQYVNEIDDEWCNWYIELYEYYPCNNKPELDKREGQITRQIGNINKFIAGRTSKEYYYENHEKCLNISRQYRLNNSEKILEQRKQYRLNNSEKILEQRKQYRLNNREKILEKSRLRYEANKDDIIEKQKQKKSCENCGKYVRAGDMSTHKKSQKCINFKPS